MRVPLRRATPRSPFAFLIACALSLLCSSGRRQREGLLHHLPSRTTFHSLPSALEHSFGAYGVTTSSRLHVLTSCRRRGARRTDADGLTGFALLCALRVCAGAGSTACLPAEHVIAASPLNSAPTGVVQAFRVRWLYRLVAFSGNSSCSCALHMRALLRRTTYLPPHTFPCLGRGRLELCKAY